jgi:hypothetical protein
LSPTTRRRNRPPAPPLNLLHTVLRFAVQPVSGCTTPSPSESPAFAPSTPPLFAPSRFLTSTSLAPASLATASKTGQDPSQTQGLSNSKRNAHPFLNNLALLPVCPPALPPSTRSTARLHDRDWNANEAPSIGRSVGRSVSQSVSQSQSQSLTSFSCAFLVEPAAAHAAALLRFPASLA